jgi:glycerol uptake facilitator-like aquaporin
MAFVYAFGHISGTHLNPAVTLALHLQGVVKDLREAFASYWLPQVLGAVVAAFVLNTIAGEAGLKMANGATVGSLTVAAPGWAAFVEALLTFLLVNTILHAAVAGKGGQLAGLAIGMTLVATILVGGPLTGASLNPARTFGPAIFTDPAYGNVFTWVIYFFGPLIGATLAVMAYQFFTDEGVEEKPAKKAPRKTVTRKTTKR